MTKPPSSTAAIRQALHQDATACWVAVKQSDTRLSRRNYIRATFAFIEGALSIMRQHVLEEVEAKRFEPTHAELALLREETYDLKDNGDVRTRDLFLPALPSLRFTFDIFAHAHAITAIPDYSAQGWQAFQHSLKIRHRITHPKATSDIDVSDPELDAVEQAHIWFLESTTSVYVEGRATLMAQLDVARRSLLNAKSGDAAT